MQSNSRLYQDSDGRQQRGSLALSSRRSSFQDTTNTAKNKEGKPAGDKQDKDGKGKDAGARIAEEKRRIRKEIIVKVNQERTERLKMNNAIFGEKWLDKCHEQVIYPNEACTELMEHVGRALARRISSPQDSEQKQQALFYLLGPKYTEQHFPTYTYSVDILEPPKMQQARKEKYLEEMMDFLRTALDKAMKDCQFPTSYSQYAVDDELFRFLQQARTVYRDGLEKEVAKRTQQMGGEREDRTAFIDNDTPYDDSEQHQLSELRRLVTVGGVQKDIAGRAIVAILRRDPTKKKDFLKSLTNKKIPLPASLRRYVWTECLLVNQRGSTTATRAGKGQAEAPLLVDPWQDQLKEFNASLVKQVKVQKLPRATRSRNSAVIDAAVIEAYDTNPILKDMDSDDHNMSTARILNAFDVYTQKFSPTHVYWLLPLQCVYVKDTNEEEGAHTLRLAFVLTQVASTLCPKQDAIFSMADRVMAIVREQDNLYYGHLTSSMSQQTSKIDTKSFPPEVLYRNAAAAEKFHAALRDGGGGSLTESDLQVFTDPAIFVRKWIAQGFVGVLSLGASLWAWDQLMLCGWSQDFTVQLCVAVLSLVRPWMMRATKYSGAKKVLLQEPGKIYTSDLLKALKHLQTEGRLGEAPPTTNYIGPPSIQVLDEYGHQTKVRQDNPRNTRQPKDADEAMEKERDIEPRTRGRGGCE